MSSIGVNALSAAYVCAYMYMAHFGTCYDHYKQPKYVHSYVYNEVTEDGLDLVKAWSAISTIAAT